MPLGSTFEIGTQIILSKIDGFLKGWILNITPLKTQLILVWKEGTHISTHFTFVYKISDALAHAARATLCGGGERH